MIKLYAWELPFQGIISQTRQQELHELRKIAYLNAITVFTWSCAPLLVRSPASNHFLWTYYYLNGIPLLCKLQVTLATFTTYSLANLNNPDERLTADKAFVALSLFNILRFPLAMLPMLISNIIQASVSVKRLGNFLKNEELDPNIVDWKLKPPEGK